jgi:hypothetical protein
MRFLILCTLVVAGTCRAEDCTPTALVSSYDDAGKPTDIVPWQPQYMDAPSWDIERGDPPLSISAAVSKATDWEKKKTKRNDIRVFSVSLMPAGCVDKWAYWVHFTPASGGATLNPSMVIVLMDGTVVGERVPVAK